MTNSSFQEYPKMLYRRVHKDTAAQNITSGVAWFIVNSADEETKAGRSGWGSLSGAQRQQKRHDAFMAPVRFYVTHWKWFWGVVLAAAVAQLIKGIT